MTVVVAAVLKQNVLEDCHGKRHDKHAAAGVMAECDSELLAELATLGDGCNNAQS